MFECKLCHKGGEVSSADKNMCRSCYNDMVNYRRWSTRSEHIPTPSQLSTINKLEQMFRHNLDIGGYVPRCYLRNKKDVECQTCGKTFRTSTGITLCWDCQIKEGEYRKLLADLERGNKTYGGLEGIAKRSMREAKNYVKPRVRQKNVIHELDAYYAELHKQGKRVPQAWIERWG